MSRKFHWQIVLPRLLTVMVLLLAAQYGLGRIARWIAMGSLEAAVATPVSIAHARVSLLDRQLVLNDLRIQTGDEPAQTLLEADCCALDFAVTPLLYKQAIFEHGLLAGVRFSTLSAAGGPQRGKDSQRDAANIQWSNDNACQQARQWLENLDNYFVKELPGQFASLEQTERLHADWPQQSAAFSQRVRDLKSRAAELQQQAQAAEVNPLRHVEFLQHLPDDVVELQTEFARANTELSQLAGSLEADRREIDNARRHDEQQLRKPKRLEPIDANLLSAYLLREQAAAQLAEAISLLKWARQVVPAEQATTTHGQRGEDITFAGCRPAPSMLVRNLQLQGTARIGGQTVELRGTLSDFTSAPALHANPIRLKVDAAGSLPLKLQATIDRTGPVARDELLVDCRGLVLPSRTLGRSDSFQLQLDPSVGSLSISALVEGEKLSGDIQLIERRVQITPLLVGQLSDVPLTTALHAVLSDLDSVAVRVSLSGTLNEPKCSLWSNLGPAVAEAMERALHRTSDERARAQLARAHQQADERLAKFQQQVQAQQELLAANASTATNELQRIAAQQAPPARLSHEQLGRRLPAGSLFR